MFAFWSASQLGNIKIAPNLDAFHRKVQQWAPWYLTKQAFLIPNFRSDNSKFGFNKEMQKENAYVEEENKKKNAKQAHRGIAKLDRSLVLKCKKL